MNRKPEKFHPDLQTPHCESAMNGIRETEDRGDNPQYLGRVDQITTAQSAGRVHAPEIKIDKSYRLLDSDKGGSLANFWCATRINGLDVVYHKRPAIAGYYNIRRRRTKSEHRLFGSQSLFQKRRSSSNASACAKKPEFFPLLSNQSRESVSARRSQGRGPADSSQTHSDAGNETDNH